MKKNYLFLLIPLMIGMSACKSSLNPDDAKAAVMSGERNHLPMLIQQLSIVDEITIDSMQILVDSEPMSGYLYTTWTKGKRSTPIIIEVDDIQQSAEHKGYIEWRADWENARKAYLKKHSYGGWYF